MRKRGKKQEQKWVKEGRVEERRKKEREENKGGKEPALMITRSQNYQHLPMPRWSSGPGTW